MKTLLMVTFLMLGMFTHVSAKEVLGPKQCSSINERGDKVSFAKKSSNSVSTSVRR